MKVFKSILKEFGSLFVCITAIVLAMPWFWLWDIIPVGLFPIGIIYTFSKPFYDYRGRAIKKRISRILKWILNVFYQLWVIIKYFLFTIGYIIDLAGNVLLGELIEDLVTSEEYTYFGEGDITISAALGDLKRRGKLNKFGLWFANVLSFLDPKHDDHCIAAIELYDFKRKQK